MGSPKMDVGASIRAYRKKNGLSLTDLSRKTGIAASNLSSIELNKTSPTLNTLVKIASAFDMAVGRLLDEVLYRKALLCRKGEAPRSETSAAGVSVFLLTENVVRGCMESRLITLESGSESYAPEEDETDRFLHCIDGELTALVADEVYNLEAGDSLYLVPEARLALTNKSEKPARLLVVTGRRGHLGENLHVRPRSVRNKQ